MLYVGNGCGQPCANGGQPLKRRARVISILLSYRRSLNGTCFCRHFYLNGRIARHVAWPSIIRAVGLYHSAKRACRSCMYVCWRSCLMHISAKLTPRRARHMTRSETYACHRRGMMLSLASSAWLATVHKAVAATCKRAKVTWRRCMKRLHQHNQLKCIKAMLHQLVSLVKIMLT